MTTVVYKDGYMACDGRVTCSNFIHSDTCNKITKIDGRGWYGWSGDEAQAELFFDILKQEAPTKPIIEIDFRDYLEIRLIHVDLEGKVSYISVEDGRAVLFSPTEPYMAIGSGGEYATTAIRTKPDISALEAVKIAVKCDVFSGGKIRNVKVGK